MRSDSYLRTAGQLTLVVAALGTVAAFGLKAPSPAKPVALPAPRAENPPKPTPPPMPAPEPPPAPVAAAARTILDERVVAASEARLREADAEAEQSQARAKSAEERLEKEQARAAEASAAHERLAAATPTSEVAQRHQAARATGEVLKVERDKLRGEIEALNDAPRPRRKILIDKSPVAKKADGEEFHFEVRGDRVAFIDLERLLDRVKTDAKVQIRLSGGMRSAVGTVGPIGAFQMHYEVGRLDNGENPRMGSFGLSAWEITGVSDIRGETFTAAMGPASDFARAIRRLNPTHDVVTLWIYPDAFPLYRQLRDALHAQGFLVAGRPLPEGMTIRGSPAGSASSAQ